MKNAALSALLGVSVIGETIGPLRRYAHYAPRETPQHIQDAIIAKAKAKRERKAKKRLSDLAFKKRYAHQI